MDIKSLAQRSSEISGIPAPWIQAQWIHETGNFTSSLSQQDNNFGGLKDIYGNYMTFNTPEDFANYFGKYLRLYKPDGIYNATTPEQYVASLKNGGYFTDDYDNYLNGVKSALSNMGNNDISSPAPIGLEPKTYWETMKDTINNGLNNPSENFKNDPNFNKSIVNPTNGLGSNFDKTMTTIKTGAKNVGLVFVGLILLVFGVFLLTKDNTMVIQYAKKGDE